RKARAFLGFDLPDFDAAEPAQVAAVFAKPWSALINCAAYTNVDAAEANQQAAMRGNATAPRVLADACKRAGIPLVHFSTDYVFAGNADKPYPVDAPLQPLGAYGRTIAKLTRDKPALKVVDDQRGRPTSAEHLAAPALALLDRGARGTFHVTDGGECS